MALNQIPIFRLHVVWQTKELPRCPPEASQVYEVLENA